MVLYFAKGGVGVRRLTALFLTILVLVGAWSAALAAGPNGEISLGLDEDGTGRYADATVQVVRLTLNGKTLDTDVPAFTRGGRTMVPVRVITEEMGASVAWMAETNQVAVSLNGRTVTLKIGSPQALVDGESVTLYDNIPAMVAKYQGIERTMVPLRFVAEQLGAWIGWEQDTYTAAISTQVYQVTDIHADANALPFAEGYFDAMVSVDAYHYFGLEADFFPRVIRPLLKENALTAIAVPGMKQPMQDVPPEMTPYWRPEDLACWQTVDFWDGRLGSLTERKSWEMACFDTAWTEWMATDNPYAVSDRPMMATDGGRYMNLVAVRGKAAPYSG